MSKFVELIQEGSEEWEKSFLAAAAKADPSAWIWPDFIWSDAAETLSYYKQNKDITAKFKYLGGTNKYGTSKDQDTNVRIGSLGFAPKDDSGLFYNPDHWEIVKNVPLDKPFEYWYNTDSRGEIALKAKTDDARKFLRLPSSVKANSAFGDHELAKVAKKLDKNSKEAAHHLQYLWERRRKLLR